MTLHDFLQELSATMAQLCKRKVTGRHVIVVDMNQGGIGNCGVYGSSKVADDEVFLVTKKSSVKLRGIE